MKLDFKQPRRLPTTIAAVIVALGIAVIQGAAQQPGSLFKANPHKRDEPIKITSATLEVRDKQKLATFTGDVHVIQGDTDLKCAVLVVYYDNDQDGRPDSKPGTKQDSKQVKVGLPGSGDRGKIRRMEAKGSVIMTQKDQRAVGDHADFDVPKNVMVLTGNVVVTRGEDIIRGRRLLVDMTTGLTGWNPMAAGSMSCSSRIPGSRHQRRGRSGRIDAARIVRRRAEYACGCIPEQWLRRNSPAVDRRHCLAPLSLGQTCSISSHCSAAIPDAGRSRRRRASGAST